MVGKQVKSDVAEPEPSASASASQPQAMEADAQHSTSAEDSTKNVIIDAKTENARDQIREAKAVAEMYDKVRDSAAGPTAAPATMTSSSQNPSRRSSSSGSSTSTSSRTSISLGGSTRGRDRRPPRSPARTRMSELEPLAALLRSGKRTRRGTKAKTFVVYFIKLVDCPRFNPNAFYDSFQCRVTMTMTELKVYTSVTKAKSRSGQTRTVFQFARRGQVLGESASFWPCSRSP